MPAPNDTRPVWAARWFWLSVTLAAVVLHVVLLPLSPKLTRYPGDHDDFVRWGIQATDRGLLTMYSEPPALHPMQTWSREHQAWGRSERPVQRTCNYPPGAVYLLWLSGLVHKAISADDRLINTVSSRVTYLFWSALGDFLVAWGCAAIVRLFRPGWAARLTYALVLLLPPLWWDSIIWGQMDSVVLAPAVWMLYFMIRRRWLLAGVLWGVAFGLKTQAILFIPLWGLALFIGRPRRGPWLGGVAALAALGLISLPYTLTGGWSVHGPDWFRLAYWENLFEIYAHLTTLKAFNLWYLDLLITDSLHTGRMWLGISKGAWGKFLLAVGLLAFLALAVRRWRNDRRALLWYSAISLLLFMILPTNVHERYLILALPFLGMAAALHKRFLPGLVLLIIVFMAQVTWPNWLRSGRGQLDEITERQLGPRLQWYDATVARRPNTQVPPRAEYEQRIRDEVRRQYLEIRAESAGLEWLFTIFALLGTLLTIVALLTLKPVDDVGQGAPRCACGP